MPKSEKVGRCLVNIPETAFCLTIVRLFVPDDGRYSCFRSLFFGDYMKPDSPERIYDEVTDLSQLTQQMEG